MKVQITIIFVVIATAIQLNLVYAQAPSSLLGDGCLQGITTGTYPLAGYGYSIFLPANSGNSYQLIGIYNVADSTGTYDYTPTSSTAATVAVDDSLGGLGDIYVTFTDVNSGTFNTVLNAYPSANQSGDFSFASYSGPSSVAGKTLICSIVSGAYPFYTSGSYTLYIASTGNTYTTSAGDSGTYSYSLVNRSTGQLQLNSTLIGSFVGYFGYTDPLHGGFAATQSSTGGYQVGNFTQLDTTPPTISITSPISGQRWSNSVFTVTGTASDDVQVSAVYYQIFGQGWNLATTSNGWTNWSGNISLSTIGTNVIQAYSVDTSGNSSVIASQNMVYVVTQLATVQTNGNGSISPNYNGQQLVLGNNYSMTATAGSGFAFVNWTGSVMTNNATVKFVMVSNLVLTANFADVTKPTVAIEAPTAGQSLSNQVFTIQGTAGDNVAVTNVFYQLDGSGWNPAPTTNNWTNWQATVSLESGNNILQAYAVDSSGNLSTTSSVSFIYIVSDTLRVQSTGQGTISPNYSNAVLQVGKSYSMTAAAASGFAFTNWVISTNWVGGVISNNTTLGFVMESNLTIQANFADTTRPTILITAPTAGQRWTNAVFNVTGTAGDNVKVSNVWYQINGLEWDSAITTNNWSNWTAQVTLTPGTNSFVAYSADTSGNVSLTNRVNFQFVVTNQLQVSSTGLGTISPNYSNSWLEIGRNYSMTAAPATGFVVTNWTVSTNWIGERTTNNATVQFMMASNLTLQVNFADITKPTLTVTAPIAGQHMINALATVVGTASDNWKIYGVWCQLNSGEWSLANTTNNFTNWTTTVTLIVGTNTVKSYALDLGGNVSLTNTLSVVSSNTFMLQLAITNSLPLTTNGLVFNLQLSTGLNGDIQFSTNLTSWATLTHFVGTNSTITFRDPAATNFPSRFYRAVIP